MKKIYLIIILFFIFSCDRESEKIQAGIQTKISGKLSEQLGDPIPNVKILIGEYVYDGQFDKFIKWIDSTYSDENGKYEKIFTTTGNGDIYKLTIPESPINEQKYFGEVNELEIKNIGSNFIFNNDRMFNLYPCDVELNTNNSSIFPISISHGTTYTFNNDYIINEKGISIKRIYRTKNHNEPFYLNRTKANGKSQIAKYLLPATYSTQNTTENILVNDSDFIDQ